MAVAFGNGAETISSGTWDCTSLPVDHHVSYCADVASTPWGQCDGTCLFNDQAGMPQLYLPCFTAQPDMTNLIQSNGAFWLSFNVMIVWLPNSTLPNEPPATQIQVNAVVATASINQSSWIPLLSKTAAFGYFTTFSWRSIVPLSRIRASNPVMINLDHAPAGNGSYGVYVDQVVLSASSPNPSASAGFSTTPLTATATRLASGEISASGSWLSSTSGNQTASSGVLASDSLSQHNMDSPGLSSTSTSGHSDVDIGVATGAGPSPSNRTMLIGLIVGLLSLLLIGIFAFFWMRRIRRTRQSLRKNESSLYLSPMAPPYTRSVHPTLGDRKAAVPLDNAKGAMTPIIPSHEGISPTYDLDRPPAYDSGETTSGENRQRPANS